MTVRRRPSQRCGAPAIASAVTVVTLLTACSAGLAASSEGVAVTTSVEPREVEIGSPFRYTMRFAVPAGTDLEIPVLADRVGVFQITDFGESRPEGDVPAVDDAGRRTVERWYELRGFEPGTTLVPGVSFSYRPAGGEPTIDYLPDTVVTVSSLLDAERAAADFDGEPVLRDIKGPVAAPAGGLGFAAIAGAVAVVLALLAVVAAMLKRRDRAAETAAVAPHEWALAALDDLEHRRLIDDGRVDEYYVGLTDVVRRYVEARFDVHAPEMTTEEFLQATGRRRMLADTGRTTLQSFLSEADLVKFARHVPGPSDAGRAMSAARGFIEMTAPRETETPDGEGARRALA